ncbi:MAG: universal stress protein [Aeromicrobium sp.]
MKTARDVRSRTRSIVVGVVGDRCSGSMVYALKTALEDSATLRVVRVSEDGLTGRADLCLPVQTIDATGDPLEVLVGESRGVDLLVVETPSDPVAASTDPLLVQLRRRCETLLVEVDHHGEVVRACGPEGWSYSTDGDPAAAAAPASPTPERVICVGVDASPASAAAVSWASIMATQLSCSLRLVGVYGTDASATTRTRTEALTDLAEATSRISGPAIESVVVQGEPAESLLDASRGAALLVVGRHGTQGMIHSALGGVGETCARLADCPVVIVPAPTP